MKNGSDISPVIESHDDSYLLEGFSGLSVLDEESHLSHIKSFVIDTKPQTPLELLQADFPSTPSAVFASRYGSNDGTMPQSHTIDETDELDDVLTGVDQTTLSMPDAYNAEEEESYATSTLPSTANGQTHTYPTDSSGPQTSYQFQHQQQPHQHQGQQKHTQHPSGFHPHAPPFHPSYTGGSGGNYPYQPPPGQNVYHNQFPPQQQQQMGYGGGAQGQGGYVMGMNMQQPGGGMYPVGNMGMAGNGYSGIQHGPGMGYVMQDGTVSMGVLDATGMHPGHGQMHPNGYYMNGGMPQQMGGAGPGQQGGGGMYMDPNYYRMGMQGGGGGYMQAQQQPEVAYSNSANGGDGMSFVPYGQQQQGGGGGGGPPVQMSSNAPYWAPNQQQPNVMYQQHGGPYMQAPHMMSGGHQGGGGRGGGSYASHNMQQTGHGQLADSGMSINAPPFVHASPMRGGPGGGGQHLGSPVKPHNGSGGGGDFGEAGGGMGSDAPGSALLGMASPVRDQSGSSMSDPLSPGGGGHMHGGRGGGADRRAGRGGGQAMGGGRGGVGATAGTTRDVVVDDFRNTYGKGRQWEIGDLVGHVVPFCQDQHGSRFIQQRLEVASDSDKQVVFDEVLPSAHSLMTDVFGNYVIQKLFEFGTPDQCETLAALLMGQAVPLAMQMYGCRVIQKALEYVQTPRLIALVGEFEGQQVSTPPLVCAVCHGYIPT